MVKGAAQEAIRLRQFCHYCLWISMLDGTSLTGMTGVAAEIGLLEGAFVVAIEA